jgi:hypothetical protein
MLKKWLFENAIIGSCLLQAITETLFAQVELKSAQEEICMN